MRAAMDVPPTVALLQTDLDARFNRARFLNICPALAKADLLHMIPLSTNRTPLNNLPPILLGTHQVFPSPAIKILGV